MKEHSSIEILTIHIGFGAISGTSLFTGIECSREQNSNEQLTLPNLWNALLLEDKTTGLVFDFPRVA